MIKLKPTLQQRKLINEIFDVTRYIYNKANAIVKTDIKLANFQDLRNKLVTEKTNLDKESYKIASIPLDVNSENKTNSINENEILFYICQRRQLLQDRRDAVKNEIPTINNQIRDFEKRVSKEIRACAVKNLCDAYKTALANFKAGNIKYFNINYKKKNDIKQCFELASTDIKMTNAGIRICPTNFGEHSIFRIGKKNHKKYKDIIIKSNCDLIKRNDGYYIGLVLPTEQKDNEVFEKFCGVDPGVRTFLTCYGSNGIVEYQHDKPYLKKLNSLLIKLKNKRNKKRIRKKTLTKIDVKRKNFIDDVHWKSINSMLKLNDVIFFGDIKSHNIVNGGKNPNLNRQMNELKFYIFKSRLLYKAKLFNKKVVFVNESYTTQCCSCCGELNKTIGSSQIYTCKNKNCNAVYGRDINSAKNIAMKGLLC